MLLPGWNFGLFFFLFDVPWNHKFHIIVCVMYLKKITSLSHPKIHDIGYMLLGNCPTSWQVEYFSENLRSYMIPFLFYKKVKKLLLPRIRR